MHFWLSDTFNSTMGLSECKPIRSRRRSVRSPCVTLDPQTLFNLQMKGVCTHLPTSPYYLYPAYPLATTFLLCFYKFDFKKRIDSTCKWYHAVFTFLCLPYFIWGHHNQKRYRTVQHGHTKPPSHAWGRGTFHNPPSAVGQDQGSSHLPWGSPLFPPCFRALRSCPLQPD